MYPKFTTQESLDKRLQAVGKPLLVLFGSEDQIAIDMAADLTDYRALPISSVHVIEGAGHSPMVEKPTETLQYLTGFISSP
jgi:pimeloyl-ACP methyl ester carboxylesterase